MAEKRTGLQALIKSILLNAQRTLYVIQREALASRQISPELNEVLIDVVSVVNLIKTPLTVWLFSALCEKMGVKHSAVLFHIEARSLSRSKVLSRVFELREEISVFLEEEHMHEVATGQSQ